MRMNRPPTKGGCLLFRRELQSSEYVSIMLGVRLIFKSCNFTYTLPLHPSLGCQPRSRIPASVTGTLAAGSRKSESAKPFTCPSHIAAATTESRISICTSDVHPSLVRAFRVCPGPGRGGPVCGQDTGISSENVSCLPTLLATSDAGSAGPVSSRDRTRAPPRGSVCRRHCQ